MGSKNSEVIWLDFFFLDLAPDPSDHTALYCCAAVLLLPSEAPDDDNEDDDDDEGPFEVGVGAGFLLAGGLPTGLGPAALWREDEEEVDVSEGGSGETYLPFNLRVLVSLADAEGCWTSSAGVDEETSNGREITREDDEHDEGGVWFESELVMAEAISDLRMTMVLVDDPEGEVLAVSLGFRPALAPLRPLFFFFLGPTVVVSDCGSGPTSGCSIGLVVEAEEGRRPSGMDWMSSAIREAVVASEVAGRFDEDEEEDNGRGGMRALEEDERMGETGEGDLGAEGLNGENFGDGAEGETLEDLK